MDPREFDRRVIDNIDHIVAAVTPAHLALPSPCTDWSLGDLLRHMVGHHRGFTAAALGEPTDPEVWDGATLGDSPAGTYREAAQGLRTALDTPELLSRRMEVFGFGMFSAGDALRMHAVDFLGHGWDVARSIGVDDRLDDDLCLHALELGSKWPDVPAIWGPKGPFRERVAVAADAPPYQRLMGFLGRDPSWSA
ncbi:uncharacterized protein (TIGR03086 family) [Allocatelliglobosispora scoriae]|uniref:Uncharacterized protein (TIGR03086 family) n=1 Tax=Allocatelliglobosispora scoriae TaxID=643052 RepID=A0A841C0A6_9ACTN|nr:TIGR03086 family metal-binding protein [Allocatelliglobosispora scoriae]MBB5872583.1 uncharacterized protein (TIGR03086 family) [Allocatelliglobosispora scoriae]